MARLVPLAVLVLATGVNTYYQASPGNLNPAVVEVILKHRAKICPPGSGVKETRK
jgi:hypothetical protein